MGISTDDSVDTTTTTMLDSSSSTGTVQTVNEETTTEPTRGNNSHPNPSHELNKNANHVYIQDDTYSWVPALVLERPTNEAKIVVNVPQYINEQSIQCDGGKMARKWERQSCDLTKYPNNALPLQNVNAEGTLQVVEDMVDLAFLHEVSFDFMCGVHKEGILRTTTTRCGTTLDTLRCRIVYLTSPIVPPLFFLSLSLVLSLTLRVSQAAILYNLKARHVRQLPYTRTGDIVIAVNPYVWITDLYSYKQRQYYGQNLVWNPPTLTEDPRRHLPPHVYEASCLAYKGLLRHGQNQSILVSGESGAGKTETVKILLGDIANVQKGPLSDRNVLSQIGGGTTSGNNPIVQKVLDSNPLLEAFGNAQTLRNDNSSRFGKYLQLQFDCISELSCILAGSTAEVYLLEKSRVTMHHPEERTFHIFYQLLAADDYTKAQIWNGLVDTDNESFSYVGYTNTTQIEGMSDTQRFQQTVDALGLIGVTGERLLTLWRALCIVLQLGNLEFIPSRTDSDVSVIADEEELLSLAQLMGIDPIKLTTALTIRTVEARSETFSVPLNVDKAKESTDAFAKEIYAKTFLWLVRTINDATCAELNYFDNSRNGTPSSRSPTAAGPNATMSLADSIRARTAGATKTTPTTTSSISTTTTTMPPRPLHFGVIGLLDIFGFETFEINRFEQLCINYCNEKLQQKFTEDIFRSVQLEYQMEGIALEEITYDDNTDVLDLVEGKMGLLAFLNEECVRPKGSDKTFVYKVASCNKENRCFVRAKHAQDHEFGIRHYAGIVMYDATHFVIKNMVRF